MNSNLPRLIFSKRLGMLVAVAETVMSQGKGSGACGASGANGVSDAIGQASTGLSAASEALASVGNNDPGKQSSVVALRSFCVALTLAFAAQDIANAGQPVSVLPSGATVVSGSATISTPTTNSMIINQSSQNAILNWQSFGIGAGASVQFVQPNANAATLNRVLGSSATVIDGSLSANGRVLIVNPNGVVFGHGSYVDVGGLLATTKSISDTNFLVGNYQFIGTGTTGRVLNYGNIKADNGYVVLLSDNVANAGTIQANGGRVILGAGDSATLALSNGQVVNIVIDKSSAQALVDNSGTIKADGGVVLLSARGNSDVLDSVLNISGLVSAKGGVVNIDGGSNGAVILTNATVDVSGATGIGGNAIVQGQFIGIVNGTNINASGASGGGHIVVGGDTLGALPKQNISYAREVVIDASSSLNAAALNFGNGGTVETSGHGLTAQGKVNAQGAAGGKAGLWLIDPTDMTIDSGAILINATSTGGVFTGQGTNGRIPNTSIQSALNAGTDVSVFTSSPGTDVGNLNVNASIYKTAGAGASLYLYSSANITVQPNVNISSTSGGLNLTATANSGTITFSGGNTISLNGGNLNLIASGANGNDGIIFSGNNSSINAAFVNLTGSSGTGAGVAFDSLVGQNLNISSSKDINIFGNSTGNVGVGISSDSGSTNLSAAGNVSWTGNANYSIGVGLGGTAFNITATGGNISIVGNGPGDGVYINPQLTTLVAGNNISLIGTANASNAVGVYLGYNINSNAGGTTSIQGTSTTNGIDVLINSQTSTNILGSGDITISGTTPAAGTAVGINGNGVNLTSTLGNVSLNGISQSGNGLALGAIAFNISAGQNINLTGNSSSAGSQGILLSGGASAFVAMNNIGLYGTGLDGIKSTGSYFNITGNNVSMIGNGTNGRGIYLNSPSLLITLTGGDAVVIGKANGSAGLDLNGANNSIIGATNITVNGSGVGGITISTNLTAVAGNNIAINGVATTGNGLYVVSNSNLTSGGNISLSATTVSGTYGVALLGQTANLNATNGNISLSGSGTTLGADLGAFNSAIYAGNNITILGTGIGPNANGLYFYNVNSSAGAVTTLQGSGNGYGLELAGAVSSNLSGAGDISLTGNSSGNANALCISGGSFSFKSSQGNVTLSANATAGSGVYVSANSLNIAASAGNLTISGNGSSTGTFINPFNTSLIAGQGITLVGVGGTSQGNGLYLGYNLISSSGGSTLFKGAGTGVGNAYGVELSGAANSVIHSNGGIVIDGTAAGIGNAVCISGNTVNLVSVQGDTVITAQSSLGTGLLVTCCVLNISSQAGNIVLSGQGASTGAYINPISTILNASQNVNVFGTGGGANSNGLYIGYNLNSTAGGNTTIEGGGTGTGYGLQLAGQTASAIIGAGDISIFGSGGGSGTGLCITGTTVSIASTQGNVTLTGNSGSGLGISTNAGLLNVSAARDNEVLGESANNAMQGILFAGGQTLLSAGNHLTLSGLGNDGIEATGTNLNISANNIFLLGDGTTGRGIFASPSSLNITATGGDIDIEAVTKTAGGIDLFGANNSLGGATNITINASGTTGLSIPNNLTISNANNLTIIALGSNATGLNVTGKTLINTGGNVTILGNSALASAGINLVGSLVNVTTSVGDINISGNGATTGLVINATKTYLNAGNNLTAIGAANDNSGNGSLIGTLNSNSGNVTTIRGLGSGTGYGAQFGTQTSSNIGSVGDISFVGLSIGNNIGLNFLGGSFNISSSQGNVTVQGGAINVTGNQAGPQNGIVVNTSAINITATAGNISLIGNGSTSGIYLNSTDTFLVAGNNISVIGLGIGANGSGLYMANILSNAGGTTKLQGLGQGTGYGLQLAGQRASTISGVNDIYINGGSLGNATGISIAGNTTMNVGNLTLVNQAGVVNITSTQGNVSLLGGSISANATYINVSLLNISAGQNINLSGTSTSNTLQGIEFESNKTLLAATNSATLIGSGVNGIQATGAYLNISGNNITLVGTGTSGRGIAMNSTNLSIIATGGDVLIVGNSSGTSGIDLFGSFNNITGAMNVTLNGSGTNGLYVSNNLLISNANNLTLNGAATSGYGIYIGGNANMAATGNASLSGTTVGGGNGIDFIGNNVNVTATSGNVSLIGNGTSTAVSINSMVSMLSAGDNINVSAIGTGANANGLYIGYNLSSTAGGATVLQGSGTGNGFGFDLAEKAGTNILSVGDIVISGQSLGSSNGLCVTGGTTDIGSTLGNVSVYGSAVSGNGIYTSATLLNLSAGQNANLFGNSSANVSQGMLFDGAATLLSANNNVSIYGGGLDGIKTTGSFLNITANNVSVIGNGTSGRGIYLSNPIVCVTLSGQVIAPTNLNITSTGGDVVVIGKATGLTGVDLYGNNNNITGATNVTINASGAVGLSVANNLLIAAGNNISINSSGISGNGTFVGSSTNFSTAGNVSIIGTTAGGAFGVNLSGKSATISATNGSITISGNGTNTGVYINPLATALTAGADISVIGNGSGSAGNGLYIGYQFNSNAGGATSLHGYGTGNGFGFDLVEQSGSNILGGANISMTGVGLGSGNGLSVTGAPTTITSSQGNISLRGNSTLGVGLYTNLPLLNVSAGQNLKLVGNSSSNAAQGILLDVVSALTGGANYSATVLAANNNVSLAGYGLDGIKASGNILNISGNNVTIIGNGTNGRGLFLAVPTVCFTLPFQTVPAPSLNITSFGGNVLMSGNATGSTGIDLYGSFNNITGAGNVWINALGTTGFNVVNNLNIAAANAISINATGTNNYGALVTGNFNATSGGNVTISGVNKNNAIKGVCLTGNTQIISAPGNITVFGTGQAGVEFSNVSIYGGNVTINGTGTSDIGIWTSGGFNISAANITLIGNSSTYYGIWIYGSAIFNSTNAISIAGNGETGINITNAFSSISNGNFALTGNGTASGVNISNIVNITTNGGNVSIIGNSGNQSGITLLNPLNIKTNGGNAYLSGNAVNASTSASGLNPVGNISINTASSSGVGGGVTITGASNGSGYGVFYNTYLPNITTGGGAYVINGTSLTSFGTYLNVAPNFSQGNNITLIGNSDIGVGLFLTRDMNNISVNGSLALIGTSRTQVGYAMSGIMNLTASNGTLLIEGISQNNTGLLITGGAKVNVSGNVTLLGISGNGTGVLTSYSNLTNARNGVMNVIGNSTNGVGLTLSSTNATNAQNGTLNLIGNTISGSAGSSLSNGTLIQNNLSGGFLNVGGSASTGNSNGTVIANSTLNNNGNLVLSGAAIGGDGLQLNGINNIAANSVSGATTSGKGINFALGSNTLSVSIINGVSNGTGSGVLFSGGNNTVTGQIVGISDSGNGVVFNSTAGIGQNIIGNVSGSSNNVSGAGSGVQFSASNSPTISGTITGNSSGAGSGVSFAGGNTTINAFNNLTGNSNTGAGVAFVGGAVNLIKGVTVTGNSQSGVGINVSNAGSNLTYTGGLNLNGSIQTASLNGAAISIVSNLSSNDNSNLNINGGNTTPSSANVINLQGNINVGTGNATIWSAGAPVNQSGGAILANTANFAGSGDVVLGTIAANNLPVMSTGNITIANTISVPNNLALSGISITQTPNANINASNVSLAASNAINLYGNTTASSSLSLNAPTLYNAGNVSAGTVNLNGATLTSSGNVTGNVQGTVTPVAPIPFPNAAANGTNGGSTSGNSTNGSNASGNGTAGGNTSGNGTSGGNTSGNGSNGGNASGNSTAGGNTSGNGTSGGNTSGNGSNGGNASGNSTAGGNTSGNGTSGGNTSGNSTNGGNASGNGTSGGNSSGNGTSGGNTSGNGSNGSNSSGNGAGGGTTSGNATNGSGNATGGNTTNTTNSTIAQAQVHGYAPDVAQEVTELMTANPSITADVVSESVASQLPVDTTKPVPLAQQLLMDNPTNKLEPFVCGGGSLIKLPQGEITTDDACKAK